MDRKYRPIDIARELGLSTSALRHYESWGVVPLPERASNGYRMYTSEHLAWFRCLRALYEGFGMDLASEVLKKLQEGKAELAMWLVNQEQAKLQQDKAAADRTLQLLLQLEMDELDGLKLKPHMAIGEVAELAGVAPSAIRHWEKEGLIQPVRDSHNGYRLYTPIQLRQIMLIRTLRPTIFFLDGMKEIVWAMGNRGVEHAIKGTEHALEMIGTRIRRQFIGIHELVVLCRLLGFM
ncbi:MerR family transcriptional regulator [Paenibacillus herberti]|uniref:Transcriptional regulator n=1 Tax=Paenibacillus herberti TaxID=1619309 RepID=A0A229P2W7_9BACL|nr:MerR family transcriptional regulator [Paenibacillus herberti]OXM16235.1 transcriptional regulator [Paenibacillus herberti]